MPSRFEIHAEPLGNHHNRAAFTCGVEALDRYLQQQANQDHKKNVSHTYVLLETTTGIIVGYYCISAASISRASIPDEVTNKITRLDPLPAFLIGRLAIHKDYQRRGLGGALLSIALKRCLEIRNAGIGAALVLVDAKDNTARAFYEAYGFQRFTDRDLSLFIPMKTVAAL